MENNTLNFDLTSETLRSLDVQMDRENEIATLDCMALSPKTAATVRRLLGRDNSYEFSLYLVTVPQAGVNRERNMSAYMLYHDDGAYAPGATLASRVTFYENREDAMAAMGDAYAAWQARYAEL